MLVVLNLTLRTTELRTVKGVGHIIQFKHYTPPVIWEPEAKEQKIQAYLGY